MSQNFRLYCKDYENIENYEKALKDNFKGWEVHHRLETHTSDGERRLVDITVAELKALGMYYNRPASELIFLRKSEHSSFNKGKKRSEEVKKKNAEVHKGKHHSEETKKKMREARKGEKNPFYGKHHSEEAKKKNAEAHKGKQVGKDNPMYGKHHTDEARRKMSEANRGKKLSDEHKNKIAEAQKGKNIWSKGRHWYNNGKENKCCYECPDGFTPGRLK